MGRLILRDKPDLKFGPSFHRHTLSIFSETVRRRAFISTVKSDSEPRWSESSLNAVSSCIKRRYLVLGSCPLSFVVQAADEVNLKGVGQMKVSELIDFFKQLTEEYK